ncbi:MAG: hypothetical protein AB7N76_15460 [Planctomycetota bacterium]
MRSTCWTALLLLAGCAASPPAEPASRPEPAKAAQTAPAAPTQVQPSPLAEALTPLPSGPAVDRAFPPAVREVLEAPERCELLALVCEREAMPDEQVLGREWPIVARAALSPAKARRAVAGIFQDVLDGSAMAMCFEPHHGLIARKGRHEVQLVICYTCLQVYVYLDGEQLGGGAMATASRPLLEELLGPHAKDRLVDGRTLAEWRLELEAAQPDAPLSELQRRAVTAIAQSFAWGERAREQAVDDLRALGPRAAPALPAARELLREGTPAGVLNVLSVLRALGAAAAPAAPELVALLRRDPKEMLERELPDEATDEERDAAYAEERLPLDAIEELRVIALRVLLAGGPQALRVAEPVLRELAATDKSFESDLAREGLEALKPTKQ